MAKSGLRLALEFRDHLLSQHLAEFDAPLVKRVNTPENALGEDAVLVKSDKLAERCRREPLGEDGVCGARRATCKTARFSVMVIFLPPNMASMRARRPDSCASCRRSWRVSSVRRCFELSRSIPTAAAVRRSPRVGSAAKSCHRCSSRTC